MKYIKLFEEHVEAVLMQKIVKAMHEGIRVTKVDSSLNESSNTASFAQREIDLIVKAAKSKGDSALIEEFVPEMMALIDKFGNSGQSGGSAPYTAGAIIETLKKLLMQQPVAPIMNEEEEWSTGAMFENTWQNRRCYALFKEGKEGKPYYLDAIVWRNQDDHSYTGTAMLESGEKIMSRQFIREFPFSPKTFVVDVIEKEIGKDDFEFIVKDPKQLDEVFSYYEKYPFK